jgi:hypothetical protein
MDALLVPKWLYIFYEEIKDKIEVSDPHFSKILQMNSSKDRIRSSDFYCEYHGHKVEHLEKLLPLLRSSNDCLIWTSGDSSLDNKYWWVPSSKELDAMLI